MSQNVRKWLILSAKIYLQAKIQIILPLYFLENLSKHISAIYWENYKLHFQPFIPALPKVQDFITEPDGKTELITAAHVTHPHILPKLHASLFMLYTLNYKKDDQEYWARIYKWNRHPDLALLSFLEVDKQFWKIESNDLHNLADAKDVHFSKGEQFFYFQR